jgi:hypothetical protein
METTALRRGTNARGADSVDLRRLHPAFSLLFSTAERKVLNYGDRTRLQPGENSVYLAGRNASDYGNG